MRREDDVIEIEGLDWDDWSGRGDPRQRYRIYRLREGVEDPELMATCATEEAVGATLCQLGREDEWENCAVGILDQEGEPGKRWLMRPWLPSPGNVSIAAKVLGSARRRK